MSIVLIFLEEKIVLPKKELQDMNIPYFNTALEFNAKITEEINVNRSAESFKEIRKISQNEKYVPFMLETMSQAKKEWLQSEFAFYGLDLNITSQEYPVNCDSYLTSLNICSSPNKDMRGMLLGLSGYEPPLSDTEGPYKYYQYAEDLMHIIPGTKDICCDFMRSTDGIYDMNVVIRCEPCVVNRYADIIKHISFMIDNKELIILWPEYFDARKALKTPIEKQWINAHQSKGIFIFPLNLSTWERFSTIDFTDLHFQSFKIKIKLNENIALIASSLISKKYMRQHSASYRRDLYYLYNSTLSHIFAAKLDVKGFGQCVIPFSHVATEFYVTVRIIIDSTPHPVPVNHISFYIKTDAGDRIYLYENYGYIIKYMSVTKEYPYDNYVYHIILPQSFDISKFNAENIILNFNADISPEKDITSHNFEVEVVTVTGEAYEQRNGRMVKPVPDIYTFYEAKLKNKK
ncbi:MAG TPA: hypothetical protein VLE02_01575 [Nitrosarchaeum sp.]|nr:hypothetical protein [Nitrosarchaeum sp.]